jgi:hypothetical protein
MKVGCFRPSFQTSFHRRSIPEPELEGRTPGSSKKDQGLGFLPDQSFSRSIFLEQFWQRGARRRADANRLDFGCALVGPPQPGGQSWQPAACHR